jgi:hypothetical protein
MARMEREMEFLQRDFKAVEEFYGDYVLNPVIASGYISKLVGNRKVSAIWATSSGDPRRA